MTTGSEAAFERRHLRRSVWILAGITALGAALRFWGIGFGLPQANTRPDEETIASVAVRMFQSGPHPHFFRYPTLFMYLMTALYRLDFAAAWILGRFGSAADFMAKQSGDAGHLFLLDRITAAALGTATVPLTFVGARRLFGRHVAMIAAALLAVSFLHVRDSHFGVTDVPATFMVMLAFAAIVSGPLDPGHRGRIVVAALLCGLAAATKYNAGLIAVPLLLKLLTDNRHAERRAYTMVLVLLAIAAVGAGFLIGTPYAWIDFRHFRREFLAEGEHLRSGHVANLGLGWVHHLRFSLWYGVGPAVLVAAIAGMLGAAATDAGTAVALVSFPLAYYGVMGAGRTVFMRYMLPIVPFVCVSAAWAIDVAAAAIVRSMHGRTLRYAPIAIVLTGAIAWNGATRTVELDRLLSQTDTRLLASEWVRERYPQGTWVFQTGPLFGRVQLTPELFRQYPYDSATGRFLALGSGDPPYPPIVIVQRPTLNAYLEPPSPELERLLASHYRLSTHYGDDPAGAVYDPQDAFFVPVSGFEHVTRPGPALDIYEAVQNY